jgi:hypothetical protein
MLQNLSSQKEINGHMPISLSKSHHSIQTEQWIVVLFREISSTINEHCPKYDCITVRFNEISYWEIFICRSNMDMTIKQPFEVKGTNFVSEMHEIFQFKA